MVFAKWGSPFCSGLNVLTYVMLEMEYSSFGGQYDACGALAPKVASASAGMVLTV